MKKVRSLRRLPDRHFAVFYADPATQFKTRSDKGQGRSAERHYKTMTWKQIHALGAQVKRIAAKDAVLFLWTNGPQLANAMALIESWGFQYKTLGFCWMKADGRTIDLFESEIKAAIKMGYWTRSNAEIVLLATRGKPKRLKKDVPMGIIEPAREHSRKPDCVYGRIERLVAGPYLEMFSRTSRKGWTVWGDQAGRFKPVEG